MVSLGFTAGCSVPFLVLCPCWVMSLPIASGNATQTQVTCCLHVWPKFCADILYLSASTVGSWWSQWGVIAASHCYSWWKWWSLTLWVTVMRLWLQTSSLVSFGFAAIDTTPTLEVFFCILICSLVDMLPTLLFVIFLGRLGGLVHK